MKKVKIILYFIIFLIYLYNSYAFLISPTHYNVNFEPNTEKTLVISLVNNNQEDIVLDTYVKTDFLDPIAKEELKDAFTLNTSQVHFKKEDTIITFSLKIKFPENLSLIGTHDLRVGAVESAQEGQVAFRAANEVRILIKNGNDTIIVPPLISEGGNNRRVINQTQEAIRPSPITRALNIDVLDISAKDVYQGEKSDIIIRVKNNENFNVDITGIINVLKANTVRDIINLPSTRLEPAKITNLKTFWDTKLAEIGEYTMGATIYYQGDSKNTATTMKVKEKSFLVIFSFRNILLFLLFLALIILILLIILFLLNKKKGIEILAVETKNIFLNTIGELVIRYKNHDHQDYKVYVEINVYNINNNVVDKIGTNEEVRSKSEGVFEYNWETNNLNFGVYKIQAIINYDNKKAEKIIEIKL